MCVNVLDSIEMIGTKMFRTSTYQDLEIQHDLVIGSDLHEISISTCKEHDTMTTFH